MAFRHVRITLVTLCTKDKKHILSDFVGEGLRTLPKIQLTSIGIIVNEAINYINKNYSYYCVENYVIMPNHIHLLISITGGREDPPLRIYDVIGRLKSFTTKEYGSGLWQRSFYDHVVRNKQDYDEIYKYICENPMRWKDDKFHI